MSSGVLINFFCFFVFLVELLTYEIHLENGKKIRLRQWYSAANLASQYYLQETESSRFEKYGKPWYFLLVGSAKLPPLIPQVQRTVLLDTALLFWGHWSSKATENETNRIHILLSSMGNLLTNNIWKAGTLYPLLYGRFSFTTSSYWSYRGRRLAQILFKEKLPLWWCVLWLKNVDHR